MKTIYIGGQIVQDYGEEPLVINKESAPLEDLAVRQGDYTKTFAIVGNAASNKVFSHFFDANVVVTNTTTTNFNPDFNPNLKAPISVWHGDLIVFEGFLKLDEVVTIRDSVIYRCTAFSGLSSFSDEIAETRLRELDLSTYDHSFNNTNVSGSWTSDYTNGYVYPMIKYGRTLSGSDNFWTIEDFRPCIYVKTIWDKIFSEAGWSYSSTFLTSSPFTKLIMTSGNDAMRFNAATINNFTFTVGNNSTYAIPNDSFPADSSLLQFTTDTGTLLDNSLQNTSGTEFNTGTYKYVSTTNARMAFRVYFDGSFEYTNGGVTFPANYNAARFVFQVVHYKSATATYDYEHINVDVAAGASPIVAGTTFSMDDPVNVTTKEFDIESGDQVWVKFYKANIGQADLVSSRSRSYAGGGRVKNFRAGYAIADGDFDCTVADGSLFGNVVDDKIYRGNTIPATRMLPEEMTQAEFIRGISNMFNLQYELSDDRVLTIEPRDDGWYDGDVVDFSLIADKAKESRIIPMGELNNKEYHFTYKEDRATWNEKYRQNWRREYGEKRVYVNTDFQTEIYKLELPFASAVLTNDAKYSNRVVTDISFYDDDGTTNAEESIPRILWFDGMVACTKWDYLKDGLNTETLSTYPYAGHLDDPITPDWDIHFFQPRNIYFKRLYGGTDFPQYPNRNLYNRYYWTHIQEITSPNSKVYEGYFPISQNQFSELSFRKLYHFRNANWKLLEVRDYDSNGENLTYMRFLLSEDIENPTFDRYKLRGGYGEEDDNGDTLPALWIPDRNTRNRFDDKEFDGSSNNVKGGLGLSKGFGNTVDTGVQGFMLLNSDDNVIHDYGAVMINTSGKTTASEDEVWINNVNYERVQTITLDNSVFGQANANPIQVLPELESNQFYDITRITESLDYAGTAYAGGGVRVIKTVTSGTILGSLVGSLTGTADVSYFSALTPPLTPDLGEAIELTVDSAEFTGSGGDVTYKFYYRIMEV